MGRMFERNGKLAVITHDDVRGQWDKMRVTVSIRSKNKITWEDGGTVVREVYGEPMPEDSSAADIDAVEQRLLAEAMR